VAKQRRVAGHQGEVSTDRGRRRRKVKIQRAAMLTMVPHTCQMAS
jgi:hypothetical protein